MGAETVNGKAMRYGIRTAQDSVDLKQASPKEITLDTGTAMPMLRVDKFKAYDTIEYKFKFEPADSTTYTLYEVEHGYDFVPTVITSFAANYESNADSGTATGDPSRFMNFEYYAFKTTLLPPFFLDTIDSEARMWAYCDAKKFYIKFRRTNGSYFGAMLNSAWTFVYRAYALPMADT
jgi:hypothetical protein